MTPTWLRSLPRRPLLVLAVAVLAFGAAMFEVPLGIASGDAFRDNDWLNTRSFDVLSRQALLDGAFPLRSPLLGGGFPVVAHPSDGTWAPTMLAVLLFGDVIGVKINLLLLGLLGAWGAWKLGRQAGLGVGAALFAAVLYAWSGWLPSMLLVGFYNQAFFLLAPAITWALLASERRPDRLLLGGLLLAFVLQQGGHAFPAVVFFVGVVAWLRAAMDGGPALDGGPAPEFGPARLLPALGLLVLGTAPLAFARELDSPLPLLAWLLGVALLPALGGLARSLTRWGARWAAMVGVACALGAARLVGLTALGDGLSYAHSLQRRDALWFPDPTHSPWYSEERFYESAGAFVAGVLGRVTGDPTYGPIWGRLGTPVEPEYAWLGLTPLPALLALVGVGLALRDRRRAPIAAASILFALVCFGWNLPPDFHFLLTWGVPTLDGFSQPLKYWNHFVLLGGVLGAGIALQWLVDGGRERIALGIAVLGLGHAFIQNRGPLQELFAQERPPAPSQEFTQVRLVAEDWWVPLGEQRIAAMSRELYLRDYGRPPLATEYENLRRGVGTIDWYGSVVASDEPSIPANYLTLDGRTLPNPRYRGEVWIQEGRGAATVLSRPNSVVIDATLDEASLVVVNQAWLDGFEADAGTLTSSEGLLAVRLPAGEHRVTLRYRPPALLAGLGLSGLALLLWGPGWWWLRRRASGELAAG